VARVVKFLLSDFLYASRDEREISLLVEMGHEVTVVCVGDGAAIEAQGTYVVQRIRKLGLTPAQPRPLRVAKIVMYYLMLAWTLSRFEADCISCHDISALFIGWLSTLLLRRPRRPLLVYDSHEFEIGRNTDGRRSWWKAWFLVKAERFLISRSVFAMMVNDSIAAEVQKVHHLKNRPVVVRNMPRRWEIDPALCSARRRELCSMLNVPEATFLMMYHGAITTSRGIETLITAAGKIEDTAVVLLGYGKSGYVNQLKLHAEKAGMGGRVLFHDAVPVEILWQYLGAADVGVMIDSNVCKSYYYSLPNKLFENIQAETPVITSSFPEYMKIVQGYAVGLCCEPHNVSEVVAAMLKMKEDGELRALLKQNLRKAKREMCWEREKRVLAKAYLKALRPDVPPKRRWKIA
jgi:glycosyltransferase involved in cell wall biosynthesis